MLFDDKYDNHFLNIVCGRARFIKFGDYTLTAIQAADMPAGVMALTPGLKAALADFRADVVTRIGADGTTQANTETEDDQWDDIHEFLTRTDVKILRPAYFDDAKGLKEIYPQKLGGLTESTKPNRLPNFEAYTLALEAAEDIITDAPGKAARKLLEKYRDVAETKDAGESGVASIIQLLGPKAEAVCWALWDVHCAGLHAFSRQPKRVKALFDYGQLPRKKRGAKKKAA
jgi:hypothetical protein